MSDDLTVENMFSTATSSVEYMVPGFMLTGIDRKRMIEHAVCDTVHQLISAPGVNPIGLTVTVSLIPPIQEGSTPNMLVKASAPQFELSDDFFRS